MPQIRVLKDALTSKFSPSTASGKLEDTAGLGRAALKRVGGVGAEGQGWMGRRSHARGPAWPSQRSRGVACW